MTRLNRQNSDFLFLVWVLAFIHLSQIHALPMHMPSITHSSWHTQVEECPFDGSEILRKAFKTIRFQLECCVSSRCCRRYGNISVWGQSFFKFCCLPLHAISRNCSASLKMDVSEIVVSEPAADFARLLMKQLDNWYISIVQWHQTTVSVLVMYCKTQFLCVCECVCAPVLI